MSRALVLSLFVLASCAAPTAADKGRTVQGALAAGKLACQLLLNDPTIPRSPEAEEHCLRVLKGCPAP